NQWNFNLLAQRLNNDFSAGADRFALQHCLFSMFYKGGYKITPGCCQLLSNHHQQFIHYAQRLADCQKKPEGYVREILMSDEIAKDTRRKLLHHLLLIATKYATPPVELEYDFLRDQYFVINPSPTSYNLEFYIPPGQPLPDNKEKVKHVLLEHGLKYASQQVRNDKDVVLPTIKEHPKDLKYVSKALKDDKDVVIAAVTQNGEELEYASPALKDNHEVVKAAVTEFPRALRFASETVRSDKNIVNMIIEQEIGYLHFASKTVLNDREYMLELIKDNHRAFIFAAQELKNDYAFIHSAILRNHKVIKYLRK
uniref:DUF4116 domain-containing protein n=1 Tax=Endozoicomonas sp. YOMI1 TaxID=2828739 RepID=UPI00214941DC